MFRTYLVGGGVRDSLLGHEPKDLDFVVVAPSFQHLLDQLASEGAEVFQAKPQFLTARVKHPVHGIADFALARTEGKYSDNRRPDETAPADLVTDLSRRDFTINAMARCVVSGEVFDPFGGAADLASGTLRAVGVAQDRIKEDPLRALRAVRFALRFGMSVCPALESELQEPELAEKLNSVSIERIGVELDKMFLADTMATLAALQQFPVLAKAAFGNGRGLRLVSTLRKM